MPEEYLATYHNDETNLTSFVTAINETACYVWVYDADGCLILPPIAYRTFVRACEVAQQIILP